MTKFEKQLHLFLLSFGNTMLLGASIVPLGNYEFAFIGLSAFVISFAYRLGFIIDQQLITLKPYIIRASISLITIPYVLKNSLDSFKRRRKARAMYKSLKVQINDYKQLQQLIESGSVLQEKRTLMDIALTPFWYLFIVFELLILVFFLVSFIRFFNENHGFTMFYFWNGLT